MSDSDAPIADQNETMPGEAPGRRSLYNWQKPWVRWLRSCSLPDADIAVVMSYNPAAVAAYAGVPRKPLAGPPRTTAGRALLAETGTRVRRLKALRYGPRRIAEILGLNEGDVRDFLERLQPLRRARLVRPRTHREAEAARQARLRAAVALKERLRRIARREVERQRKRDAEASWGPRGEALERAEWTKARARLEALQASPPADVADLDVDKLPATAASPIESPPVNPWVGPTSMSASGSAHGQAKLTEAAVMEARRLRAEGMSTGKLAKMFGCSRNTMCYALNGTTWKHCQDPHQDPPPPFPE